jgi:hypothetical protein
VADRESNQESHKRPCPWSKQRPHQSSDQSPYQGSEQSSNQGTQSSAIQDANQGAHCTHSTTTTNQSRESGAQAQQRLWSIRYIHGCRCGYRCGSLAMPTLLCRVIFTATRAHSSAHNAVIVDPKKIQYATRKTIATAKRTRSIHSHYQIFSLVQPLEDLASRLVSRCLSPTPLWTAPNVCVCTRMCMRMRAYSFSRLRLARALLERVPFYLAAPAPWYKHAATFREPSPNLVH